MTLLWDFYFEHHGNLDRMRSPRMNYHDEGDGMNRNGGFSEDCSDQVSVTSGSSGQSFGFSNGFGPLTESPKRMKRAISTSSIHTRDEKATEDVHLSLNGLPSHLEKITKHFKDLRRNVKQGEQDLRNFARRKAEIASETKATQKRIQQLIEREKALELELKRVEKKELMLQDCMRERRSKLLQMTDSSMNFEEEISRICENDDVEEKIRKRYSKIATTDTSLETMRISGLLCSNINAHQQVVAGSTDGGISFFSSTIQSATDEIDSRYNKPFIFRGHRGWVKTVQWDLQHERYFFSGGGDGKVIMWDAMEKKCKRIFNPHKAGVTCIRLSSTSLVSGSLDETLVWYDKMTGKLVQTLVGHTDFIKDCQMKENGLVSGGGDDIIRLWDMRNGRCTRTLEHIGGINSLDWTDNEIISGGRMGEIHVFDLRTNRVRDTIHIDRSVRKVIVPSPNRLLFCADKFEDAFYYDMKQQECIQEFQGHLSCVEGMSWNGDYLTTNSRDSTVKLWYLQE